MQYGLFERACARTLAKFPIVKSVFKSAYARISYLIHQKKYRYFSNHKFSCLSSGSKESFFGYYDKAPTTDGKLFLLHVPSVQTKHLPSAYVPVNIMVTDSTKKIIYQIPSLSYNWQQGTRVHWLDSSRFIFNDFKRETKTYISKIYSIEKNRIVNEYDMPVQDSYKSEYFLSISYRRLMTLRPDYGYRNLPKLSKDELREKSSEGIWYVPFSEGANRLVYSLSNICNINHNRVFNNAFHNVNHIMISPDGIRFIFIHRFYLRKRRFDRLILGGKDGGTLTVLADNGMVSHCCWVDNNTILGYLRGPNDKDAYWLIDIDTGDLQRLPKNALEGYGDGHPHVYKDWFVTDTYPDKARMQHLLLCNWKTGVVRELGQFFHGFQYKGETRCDLHPRFSPDGKSVFFDSVFDGTRKLYKMDVKIQ